ncbi:hypothetical protein FA13DRAFT_1639841 [Coprinellus micaceus]|uniref:Protein kinase domain-containing protein n=1 Tax=Coprinellus micaceus TaxID=71717 RepID=A0A4Y7SNR9_COPMI|nr:hypothetical protein FA13DRAFT_1639841 [Coprinellus micaceus]
MSTQPTESTAPVQDPPVRNARAKLTEGEAYWRDLYDWLLEQGYRLRPRYHPDWEPSWEKDFRLIAGLTEDSETAPHPHLIDAIRVADDGYVVLKRVPQEAAPDELPILQYFSEEPQHSDPRNRCVDLLDVLKPTDDEGHTIVVMPVLRPFDSPEFDTVGEGLDFIRQMLQGLSFLHEHRVAHRDIRSENFLLDGSQMYSERYRAWRPNKKFDYSGPIKPSKARTSCWPEYHIIDFGFSKQYAPEEMPPSEPPKFASDRTIPEFKNRDARCNPFPVDVYTFGNLIRVNFIEGHPDIATQNGRKGFDFLLPLVDAMVQEKPEQRVTMAEALERFDDIVSGLSEWKLRSRPVRIPGDLVRRLNSFERASVTAAHWARKLKYVVKRVPPLPYNAGPPLKEAAEAELETVTNQPAGATEELNPPPPGTAEGDTEGPELDAIDATNEPPPITTADHTEGGELQAILSKPTDVADQPNPLPPTRWRVTQRMRQPRTNQRKLLVNLSSHLRERQRGIQRIRKWKQFQVNQRTPLMNATFRRLKKQ